MHPENKKSIRAVFATSSQYVNQCPDTKLPEYAFIGRSNVGKSSLINMLTGNKKLAKTSATPGKTTLINHFLVNDEWYLVDLPGYGYAKRGKAQKAAIEKAIEGYILQRRQLVCLFLLIDIRHEPQRIDLDFISFLGENAIPFAIVFTKADKLSVPKRQAAVEKYLAHLEPYWEELPPHFLTSSVDGAGKHELLNYIFEISDSLR